MADQKTGNVALAGTASERQALLEAIPAHAALLDANGDLLAVNSAWSAFSRERGSFWAGLEIGENYLKACERNEAAALASGGQLAGTLREVIAGRSESASYDYPCQCDNGHRWFRAHFSTLKGDGRSSILAVHLDVTDEVINQQRIFALAHFDDLTGLPNRLLFLDRLRASLAHAKRQQSTLAVLQVDVDRFKVVNETLGHRAGNELLIALGQRISALLRKSDTASRLGSDEFGIIISGIGNGSDAAVVARKLISELERPFHVEGNDVFVTTSIGIALYPDDGDDAEVLIEHAYTAMLRAKDAGRNCYQYFDGAMNAGALERLRLDGELRQALVRGEFEVFYQPKISCGGGQVVGAEALLRWRHPSRGLIMPGEFIALLEENGLIDTVGGWVMLEACRQCKRWADAGLAGGRPTVAVNISVHQLDNSDLVQVVRDALANTGLPPALLELEVTESMLMRNFEQVIVSLSELRQLGVSLSVDDFGTGYSSLAYLKRFPLNAVKVDRSFVQDITADPSDASITRAVITMAHNLKLKVVAEGVETEGQLALLVANHCDEIQGYFFSPPVPAGEMEAFLRDRSRLPELPKAAGRRERTLLLVDDEENILSSLKRVLRRDGYRILTATSGAAGLELLASNEVDVIISDQRMSGMTGVEFLRRVKTIHPQTVRMVLSGYTELQSITDAINEGAIYKFLTKPWEDDLLRANIEEAFRYKELGDENRRLTGELQSANSELALTNARLLEILAAQEKRIELDKSSLDVVQEVLQCIPFPVIGFDNRELLAFANLEALEVLPGVARELGEAGVDWLPAELAGLVQSAQGGDCTWQSGDRAWRVSCRLFGVDRARCGRLLVFYPIFPLSAAEVTAALGGRQ